MIMSNSNHETLLEDVLEDEEEEDYDEREPLDPLLFLEGMDHLLSRYGGIKSEDDVEDFVTLMNFQASKLVVRCLFLNILKSTSNESILRSFVSSGGWNLLNNWLNEAKESGNFAILFELMKIYKILPVTVDVLKINTCAKTIKTLAKSSDKPTIKTLATEIVNRWMAEVRGKPADSINEKSRKKKHKNKSNEEEPHKKTYHHKSKASSPTSDHSSETLLNKRSYLADATSPSLLDSHSHKKTPSDSDLLGSEAPRPRPKTVKSLPSRFRSTGLEFETEVSVPVKKKPAEIKDVKLPAVKRALSLPKSQSSEKRLRVLDPSSIGASQTSPTEETHGKIKLIPARPRVPSQDVYESNSFFEALSTTSPGLPVRRKKRAAPSSGNQPRQGSASSQPRHRDSISPPLPTAANSPPISPSTPSQKQPAMPSFYVDTLENTTHNNDVPPPLSPPVIKPCVESENTNMETDNNNLPSKDHNDPDETSSQDTIIMEGGTDEQNKNTAVKKSNLAPVTSKKVKKSVSWKQESKLCEFRYFELDDEERINVNHLKSFDEEKKMEALREREAMNQVKRQVQPDKMTEQFQWRRLVLIDNAAQLDKRGSNSKEKTSQAEREQGMLQALYFTPEMIPDTAEEPPNEYPEPTDPKEIPLEDASAPDQPITVSEYPPMKPDDLFGKLGSGGFHSMPGVQHMLSSFNRESGQPVNFDNISTDQLKNLIQPITDGLNNGNLMNSSVQLPNGVPPPGMFPPTMVPPPNLPGGPMPNFPPAGQMPNVPPPHLRGPMQRGMPPFNDNIRNRPMMSGPQGPFPPNSSAGNGPPRGLIDMNRDGTNHPGGPNMQKNMSMDMSGGANLGPRGSQGPMTGRFMRGSMNQTPMMRGAHRGSHPGGPTICRFFNSPQGCRFGNSCNYRHSNPNQ